jgi:hypothetical protein
VSPAGPAPEIKTFICVPNRAAEEFDSRQLKSIVSGTVRKFNAQGGVASQFGQGFEFRLVLRGGTHASQGKIFFSLTLRDPT